MNKISQILTIVNMVVMVFLIITITVQNRSSGLSTVFGGGGVIHTRRGAEKWLFFLTIALGVVFVGLSIAHLFIK